MTTCDPTVAGLAREWAGADALTALVAEHIDRLTAQNQGHRADLDRLALALGDALFPPENRTQDVERVVVLGKIGGLEVRWNGFDSRKQPFTVQRVTTISAAPE